MNAWPHAAITTFGRNNHALRTARWRYIRYAGGGEELYDHQTDPYEWTNLAALPEHAGLKAELAQQFPRNNQPPVEGKAGRGGNNPPSPRQEDRRARRNAAKAGAGTPDP